jgi:ferredoxin
MPDSAAPSCWEALQEQAEAVGLNVRLVLPREEAERGFPAAGGPASAPAAAPDRSARLAPTGDPAALYPAYARAALLGSAGRVFWEGFRHWLAELDEPPPDPLDRYTEITVEHLLQIVQREDPAAVAAYPFRHPRRVVPFLGLLRGSPLLEIIPFGVAVHPEMGPWYAWRAVLLTRLPLPVTVLPARRVCADCPAPCVAACPARAVHKQRFQWESCADYRVAETTCRETCLARMACPAGTAYRYGEEQLAYHYRASLRMIEAARKSSGQPG